MDYRVALLFFKVKNIMFKNAGVTLFNDTTYSEITISFTTERYGDVLWDIREILVSLVHVQFHPLIVKTVRLF